MHPVASNTISVEVLSLYSSNISNTVGFVIIDFDIDEPLNATDKLINIIILPCGLAVILLTAGIVWVGVAVE